MTRPPFQGHGNLIRVGCFRERGLLTQPINIHTIIASSPRILALLWGVSLSFCAFAGWLFLALAFKNAPVSAGLLAGCFLIIAITMLAGTIELTLDYRRYSAVRLTLTGEPPAVGRRLDGVVELPTSAAVRWIRAELACVRVNAETLDVNRTATFEKDFWSDRRQFPVHHNGMRRTAVVGFDIPDLLPPSSGSAAPDALTAAKFGRDHYVWQLRIEASGVGPAFRRTLGVQVLPSAAGASQGRRQA